LYSYVARIRQTLASAGGVPAPLHRRTGGYLLEVAPHQVDLHRFRHLIDQSQRAESDDPQRVGWLREALDLWRGEPLAGLTKPWFVRLRESGGRQRVDADAGRGVAALDRAVVRARYRVNGGAYGAPGDWNGDGKAEVGVWRPTTGQWFVPGTVFHGTAYGGPGDIPIPADWTGDGKVDRGVWRPSNGKWFVPGVLGGGTYGDNGDIPLATPPNRAIYQRLGLRP
jgi:hypothetical protein